MTNLSPRAIEAGADTLRHLEQGGKRLNEWTSLPNATKKKWTAKLHAILTALEAEGMVVMPKHITNKMICAVIDATDKKHAPLSCTEFWDVALQAAQGGDDAGQ